MKKLFLCTMLLTALMSCSKQQSPSAPINTTSQTNTHLFVLKFYSRTTALVQRTYTCPDSTIGDMSYGELISKSDTVYAQITSIQFRYREGSPVQYSYTLAVNQNQPNDTASVELWVDGVQVASDGHFGYAYIQYHK